MERKSAQGPPEDRDLHHADEHERSSLGLNSLFNESVTLPLPDERLQLCSIGSDRGEELLLQFLVAAMQLLGEDQPRNALIFFYIIKVKGKYPLELDQRRVGRPDSEYVLKVSAQPNGDLINSQFKDLIL